jgi:hypothetical protein
MLNVDLRSTLLTLDIVQARLTLYSLNRNVNLLTVNSRCLCGFAAKIIHSRMPVQRALGCTASSAEGSFAG